jgi:hypothetical protein
MKIYNYFFASLLLLLPLICNAQKGAIFPEMETESLEDQLIKIPLNTPGRHTLVGLAYSKKAEHDLKTWFNPTYQTFIEVKENPGIFNIDYKVDVFFIPMFAGIHKAAVGKAKKEMKAGLDTRLSPHVLIYSGSMGDYKDILNLQKKDEPYIFLLDSSGRIVYHTSGSFNQKKMDYILELIDEED